MATDGLALVFDGNRLERLPRVQAAHVAVETALDDLEALHRQAGITPQATDDALGSVRTAAEDYGRVATLAAVERLPFAQFARRAVVIAAATGGLAVGVLAGVTVARR